MYSSSTRRRCPGAEDEHAVQAFAAHGLDPALRVSVRDRYVHWRLYRLDLFAAEHRVERGDELCVAVSDQKPQVATGETVDEVACGCRKLVRRVDLRFRASI